MNPEFIDMAKGFGSSAPIIVLLLYFLSIKTKELREQVELTDKRTDQLLDMIPKVIEAENDMTKALDLLSEKLKS
jgi:hypothetical protein